MTPLKNIQSIKRLLLTRILASLIILIATSIFIISNLVENQVKKHAEDEALFAAYSIAQTSELFLDARLKGQPDQDKALEKTLKKMITLDNINYVHIYYLNENSEIKIFSLYKKNELLPHIPDRINNIQQMKTLTYVDDTLEIKIEIRHEQKTYGYVFLQIERSTFNQLNQKIILIIIVLASISLFIIAMVIIRLQRKINASVEEATEVIQTVTMKKDYSLKLPCANFKELNIFYHNLTIMLERTEKHVAKKDLLNQQTLLENEKLKAQLNTRTDALKDSNHDLLSTLEKLHQFQEQLVENKKMASLGDMVAGIAHEVNTPIGLGVTASTLLHDKLIEIKTNFDDKTLKSSQLKKFLNEGEESINLIYRNLERAAELISSFKKVAVDQSSDKTQEFHVKTFINQIIISIRPKTKHKNIHFELNCPENLTVISKPGAINQVFINLILNSIIHGFEGKDEGIISISVMNLSDQLYINYADNGVGISKEVKHNLFDPFTTTKRGSGGSGLGMHLVYNLVTQALLGQVEFNSEQSEGVSFDITFPISNS